MGPGSDSFKQHTSHAPNSHFVTEQTIQAVVQGSELWF